MSPFYSAVDLGCLLNYLLAPARAKHEITELAAYRGLGKGSKEEWSHSHEPNGWLAQMTKAVATHPRLVDALNEARYRAAMAGSKAKAKASTRSSAPKPIPLPGVPSSVAQDVKQLAADYAQFITVEGVAALYRKHHSVLAVKSVLESIFDGGSTSGEEDDVQLIDDSEEEEEERVKEEESDDEQVPVFVAPKRKNSAYVDIPSPKRAKVTVSKPPPSKRGAKTNTMVVKKSSTSVSSKTPGNKIRVSPRGCPIPCISC
ncbi:hypothetical protein C8F01DRAFT_1135895 [Mycena amicta]|nr:hypothetical protein C8F01DRAFT_1179854 [Mycena amicta]KAJ7061941.1 hypothetical protein C8F01DRAFT_1135895 [Mycena amicta]